MTRQEAIHKIYLALEDCFSGGSKEQRDREFVEILTALGVPQSQIPTLCPDCNQQHLKWISCYGAAKTRAGVV